MFDIECRSLVGFRRTRARIAVRCLESENRSCGGPEGARRRGGGNIMYSCATGLGCQEGGQKRGRQDGAALNKPS